MTPEAEERARRRYRVFLWAYPAELRRRYGRDMEEAFLALLRRDAVRRGALGRLRCWAGAAFDAFTHGVWARVDARWTHETGPGEMLKTLTGDIRYAVRTLLRRPVFAITIILTMALGIGANASVFTVVNGFLFARLPYDQPGDLVTLKAANPELGWSDTDVNPADAWDWRARAHTLEDVAVYDGDGLNMTGGGEPELVQAVRTSPNLLALLGRRPTVGRDFSGDEYGADHRVAILTDGFWQRRFGGRPDMLGSVLSLDGDGYTVVGILPTDFRFLGEHPDLFIPLTEPPEQVERGGHYADAIGRLAPGATIDQARRELAGIATQLEAEHPDANKGWTVEVTSTHRYLVGDIAMRASIVLMTAVLFVLMMACVNVANLLFVRGEGRTRELAVRTALGAGRARVVRQLLTESAVLAALGGGLGLVLARGGFRLIVAGLPDDVPPVFQWSMDGRVLLFTATVTVGSVLAFGLLPALRASGYAAQGLREGGRSGRTRRAGTIGTILVVVQTALAVVLLVGGGLLMKSLAVMRNQDLGFDPHHVITVRIAPAEGTYASDEAVRAFWDAVEDRVASIPGVVAEGTTQSHPLMGSNWGNTIRLAGQEGVERKVRTTYVSPGLFEALRFRVVQGRGITAQDGADAPPAIVVNEAFVNQYLPPDEDPLQQSILAGDEGSLHIPILGVVHNVVERGVESAPEPSMYVSLAQSMVATRSLVVRTVGPPGEVVPALQKAVWSVDPDIPLYHIQTMDALVRERLGGFAVIGYLMATFAVLSLILGAVGIYGVTAYAADRRTSEIGLRLAMGAERRDVVRMVVLQGGQRAAVGLALGLVAATGLSGLLGSILVNVSSKDPLTFTGVTLVLGVVSLLGLYLPARRASRVDPVGVLGTE